MATSAIWPLIHEELRNLSWNGGAENAPRVALSTLFSTVDIALNQVGAPSPGALAAGLVQDAPPAPGACLEITVKVMECLPGYFCNKLGVELSKDNSDVEKSKELGKLGILPFDPEWPNRSFERKSYLGTAVERLITSHANGQRLSADECWRAAYCALALTRSWTHHPEHRDPAYRMVQLATPGVLYDVLALCALAVLRFKSEILKRHGQLPEHALTTLEFINIALAATAGVGRTESGLYLGGQAAVPQPAEDAETVSSHGTRPPPPEVVAPAPPNHASVGSAQTPESAPVASTERAPTTDTSASPALLTGPAPVLRLPLEPANPPEPEPVLPKPPDTEPQSKFPRRRKERLMPVIRQLVVLGTAVFAALAVVALAVSQRTQVPEGAGDGEVADAGPAVDAGGMQPAPTPTILVERCKMFRGLTHHASLLNDRLVADDGKRYGAEHLAAGLLGQIPNRQRVLVIAPTGMGKSTLALDVAERVCKGRPATFLLRPAHLSDQHLRPSQDLGPVEWLLRSADVPKDEIAAVLAWLPSATPVVIIDGLDEIRGQRATELMGWLGRLQAARIDVRFLAFSRSASSIGLAASNFQATLRLPRLTEREARAYVGQERGTPERAAEFFRRATRFGLDRLHGVGERRSYRFLSTFDDIRAAIEVADTDEIRSRRDVFEKWLLLRLPKIINQTVVDKDQVNDWLDGFLALHVSGPREALGAIAAMQSACIHHSSSGPLNAEACTALFSREALLDGDNPNEHTIAALLVARGAGARIEQSADGCGLVSELDQDAVGFLLGHPAGTVCASKLLESICRAAGQDVPAATAMADAGLSYNSADRMAWLLSASGQLAAAGAGCPSQVVDALRLLATPK